MAAETGGGALLLLARVSLAGTVTCSVSLLGTAGTLLYRVCWEGAVNEILPFNQLV